MLINSTFFPWLKDGTIILFYEIGFKKVLYPQRREINLENSM